VCGLEEVFGDGVRRACRQGGGDTLSGHGSGCAAFDEHHRRGGSDQGGHAGLGPPGGAVAVGGVLFQGGEERGGVWVAPGRVGVQRAAQDRAKCGVDVVEDGGDRGASAQQVGQHGRRGVHVAGCGDRLPALGFGAGVGGGARTGAGGTGVAGQAEVDEFGAARGVEQDVGRCDIAVHQAAGVDVGQAQQRAADHAQGLRGGQRPGAEHSGQRGAVDPFLDDVGALGVLGVAVDRDQVRVIQRGQHLRLTAPLRPRLRARRIQRLDRDNPVQGVIVGLPHRARRPRPQPPQQRITRDCLHADLPAVGG
jgi:hypothetical protein